MIWKKIKLKELLTKPVQNGYSPICPATSNGKWVLGLGALNGSGLDITQIKPAPIDDHRVDKFLLCSGDFLVSRSNTLDKVGRTALFKGEIKNCAYPDLMMRFRADDPRLHLVFLEHYLRSAEAVRHFRRAASGTSGSMMKISKNVVESLQVPLPTLTEQTAIASILSTCDVAIEKTERLIEAKEKRLSWLLCRMINEESIQKKWKQVKLGNLAEINKGQQLNVSDMINSGRYYVLNGGIVPSGFTNQWNTNENTITISEGGNSCGFVNFNTRNFWCGGHCYALNNLKDGVDSGYLFNFLKYREKSLMLLRVGSGLPNIQKKDIQSFSVALPPISQQKQIAIILDRARQEIDLLKKQANAYRLQKRGLMQKLLTGIWRIGGMK